MSEPAPETPPPPAPPWPPEPSRRVVTAVLALAFVAFVIATSAFALRRYGCINIAARDNVFFSQSLWNVLAGEGPRTTIGLRGDHLFSEHLYLTVSLLAPLYAAFPDPRLLLVVQAAAIGAAAFPLYRLARTVGATRVGATLLGLLWLTHPSTHGAVAGHHYGFHPDTFFPVLCLFALEGILREKRRRFAVLVVASLATLEQSAFPWIGVALLGFLRGRRREAVGLAAFAAAWFLVATKLVIPAYSEGSAPPWYLEQWSVGTAKVLHSLAKTVGFVAMLSLAFAILPLRSRAVVAILPPLAVFFAAELSGYPIPLILFSWHTAAITPLLGLAAAEGLVRLERRHPERRRFLLAALALTIAGAAGFDVLRIYIRYPKAVPARVAALERIAATLPQDAGVSGTFFVMTRLSNRHTARLFPRIKDCEFLVLDTDATGRYAEEGMNPAAMEWALQQYRLVSVDTGIQLWARRQ